jgi:predicted transcriptional regulator
MENQNPELIEIKQLRKKHGLTQSQLAKLARVSQSLIAKIESGNIDPTYSNVKRILEALHGIDSQKEPKAENLITKHIIGLGKNQAVIEAIKTMKSHQISQLPVLDGNAIVGLVSETTIIENMVQGKNPNVLTVSEIMEEAPPIIVKTTPVSAVTELLRYFPLVIVAEKGKPIGVITKADVLNRIR